MSINSLLRWFLTLLIIVIACVFCYIRYNAYFRNPWTRDGMVQAEVVQVAARVSGEVKTVHVRDNQFVKVGDPLFGRQAIPRGAFAGRSQRAPEAGCCEGRP